MKNTLELRRLIPVKDNQKSRKRRTKMISTFLMSREFKSKSTVNNKSLRIRIPQILSKNLQKLILSLENFYADSLITYLDKFSSTHRKEWSLCPYHRQKKIEKERRIEEKIN